MLDISTIRKEFPALQNLVYLDSAARSPMSNCVRNALEKFLDDRQSGKMTKDSWFAKVEEVRGKVARLIGAADEEIAFVKNTSEGLNIIAESLDLKPGDSVVIAPDFEHPNNNYTWLNYNRKGIRIKTIKLSGPVIKPEEILSLMGPDVKVVTLASVSFTTGGRVELSEISKICKDHDCFLMVDGVQSLGIYDLDVSTAGIGALTAATSKGLLGMYGLGILYYKRELAENVHPNHLARFSVAQEGDQEWTMGTYDYVLAAGAKRFEIGNYNFAAIFALDASLDLINSVGTKRIQEYVLSLSTRMTNELKELGFIIESSLNPANISHIVVFREPQNSSLTPQDISKTLDQKGIRNSVRNNRVRLGFHMFNNHDDIDKVVEVMRNMRG